MLTPFPYLLGFTFFTPALLRIAAAFVFAYVAYIQWERREELSRVIYPLIGSGFWIILIFVFADAVAAIGLFLGLYTELAAILGALIALKLFVWEGRYPRVMVLERPTSLLLFAICLSLLITGAGAYAFDIPL